MIDHEKRTRRRKICEANDFSDADDPIAPPHRILRHHYRATKIQLAKGKYSSSFFQISEGRFLHKKRTCWTENHDFLEIM